MRFTLLQTYKVLKPNNKFYKTTDGFTLLQTYKVLKHQRCLNGKSRRLYSLTNLQGSQTILISSVLVFSLYSLTNLQGSQTISMMKWINK